MALKPPLYRPFRHLTFLIALLVLFPVAGNAQENADPPAIGVEPEQRLVHEQPHEELLELLTQEVAERLEVEGTAGPVTILGEDSDYDEQGIELVVRLSLHAAGDALVLVYELVDRHAERQGRDATVVDGQVRRARDDVSFTDDAQGFADEIAESLRSATQTRESRRYLAPRPTLHRLLFSGEQDGVEVALGKGHVIGEIADGQLESDFIPVPRDNALTINLNKEGYFPQSLEYVVRDAEPQLELPELTAERRWEASVRYRLNWLVSAGAGVRRYVVPGAHFLELSGIVGTPSVPQGAWPPVMHRFDVGFDFGSYLSGSPGDTFRTGVTTGVGIQPTVFFDWEAGSEEVPPRTFVDPYLKLAGLFGELELGAIVPFVEADLLYGLQTAGSILEPGFRMYVGAGVRFR